MQNTYAMRRRTGDLRCMLVMRAGVACRCCCAYFAAADGCNPCSDSTPAAAGGQVRPDFFAADGGASLPLILLLRHHSSLLWLAAPLEGAVGLPFRLKC